MARGAVKRIIKFADGRQFLGWRAASAAYGLIESTLKSRKKNKQPPFGDRPLACIKRPDLAALSSCEEEKEQERRIAAIRQELVICRLERLTRPENAAAAMVVIGRCKQMIGERK